MWCQRRGEWEAELGAGEFCMLLEALCSTGKPGFWQGAIQHDKRCLSSSPALSQGFSQTQGSGSEEAPAR
jgi:hypothetical protein